MWEQNGASGPPAPSVLGIGGGFPGLDGNDGDDGFSVTGPPGAAGARGVAGAAGPPGDDGQPGDDGTPASSGLLLPAASPPLALLVLSGAPGDDGAAGEDGAPASSGLLAPAVALLVLGVAGGVAADSVDGPDETLGSSPGGLLGPTTAPFRGATLLSGGALIGSTAVPQFQIVQGTNFPVASLAFDVATTDTAYWNFPLRGYSGGPLTVQIYWYAAATTNNVKWEIALAAITVGTDTGSIEAKAFNTALNVTTAANTNAKAGSVSTISVTGASLDSAADGDVCTLRLKRIAATGEMTGSALLWPFVQVGWS